MWPLTYLALILATATLCRAAPESSFEYEDDEEPRPSHLSRRAIDGTRGRKYYDPQEDGFFDDFGSERGRYYDVKESTRPSDLKNNVPGEPGIDYPAYEKIPKTAFSCFGRERGYYADEESGCQVFHVCEDGLVSSFLCPVGSLFSQRLLTCDWWSKVPCSQSHRFYGLQSHPDGVALAEGGGTIGQAVADSKNYKDTAQIGDQETAPVFLSIKRNENHLVDERKRRGQHQRGHFYQQAEGRRATTEKPADAKIIRIRLVGGEKRKNRVRGNVSFRSSNSSQGQRQLVSQEASSVEPSVTMPTVPITVKSSTSMTLREKNNRFAETTPASYEVSSQEYQDSSVKSLFEETSERKGLEEDGINKSTSPSDVVSHNSASEFDDMEGKDSIGLAKSHVERNLDREEGKSTTVQSIDTPKNEIIIVESPDNSTGLTITKEESTTEYDESIQLKESIDLIHSRAQEKLQLHKDEKHFVTKNFQNSTDRITEKTEQPTEISTSDINELQYDSSTLLYNNVESSTEINNYYTNLENTSEEITELPKTQKIRKMPGFRIHIVEEQPLESTPESLDEISSSDYHELLNSTSSVFITTVSPNSIESSDELSTDMPNIVRRILDTLEESNSPLGVRIPLNYSRSYPSNDLSIIDSDIVHRLITQHATQLNLPDFNTLGSDENNKNLPLSQNQHQIIYSAPGVRTYQHIRNYQNNQEDNQNYNPVSMTAANSENAHNQAYQQEYISITTQVPDQNYINYQNYEKESKNLDNNQFKPELLPAFNNYQQSPQTTQEPFQNFVNYQNYNGDLNEFTNYQKQNDESKNLGKSSIENIIPTTAKNYLMNYEEPLHMKSYQNQPDDSKNINIFQTQHNQFTNFKNLPEEGNAGKYFRNHQVNYQTHHYPENLSNYQERRQNYNSDFTEKYESHQHTEKYKHYKKKPDRENSEINSNNQQKDYSSDYNNYDSSEVLTDTAQFEEFGARLSAKNPNNDILKTSTIRPKSKEEINTQMINVGFRGKPTNFLWAMTQLVKNDRLPRPFTQNKLKFIQNINSQENPNYSNNFASFEGNVRNHFDNSDESKQVSSNINNYNSNYKENSNNKLQQSFHKDNQNVNLDELVPPNLEPFISNFQNQNFNIHTNQRNENFDKHDFNPTLNNQQNFSTPRQDTTLNYNPTTPLIESLIHNVQNTNTFNTQSTPQVNPLPYNENQPFVPPSSTDFNDYGIENSHGVNKKIEIIPNSQSDVINFQQSTSLPTENYRLEDKTNHILINSPLPIDYNYPSSTPSTFENTRIPDAPTPTSTQSQLPDYNLHERRLSPILNIQDSNKNFYPVENSQTQSVGLDIPSPTQQTIQNTNAPNKIIQTLINTPSRSVDYGFRPTTMPSIKNTPNGEVAVDNQSNRNANLTKMLITTKTIVETEFIPSLSFDFGSVEGRKEYLDALEKGLVPNEEGLMEPSKDARPSESENVEKTLEIARDGKSMQSDVIDNFKDTSEVMSEAE